ncbi:hypothetical protein PENTCL1PPCAC_12583, partial [Pristionchus entomophagus]
EEMKEEEEEHNGNFFGFYDHYEDDEEEFPEHRITFYKEKSYSSDCIRRIAKNVSVGSLDACLTGSSDFHSDIF